MGEMRSIEQRIAEAETRWPGLQFKRTGNEAHSACPICGGEDRHIIFEDGGYFCRQCDAKGWLDDDQHKPITEAQLTQIRIKRLEYQQAEHDRRLTALEKIHGMMHVADFYHGNLASRDNDAFEYWLSEGMFLDTIDQYKLGYCSRCPTDAERRASYTIPVIIHDKLFNIRHRLIQADNGDKYRPEIAGLPNVLFNADNLYADTNTILIVEGEKKAIHVSQLGFPNVGMMGKSGFKPEWSAKFHRFSTVYIALDPDAEEQAVQIAALFKGRGRVVLMPGKVDDMVTRYGATHDDILWFIKRGMRV